MGNPSPQYRYEHYDPRSAMPNAIMPRYTIPRTALCSTGGLPMFAVIAFICGVVAAILKLTDKHTDLLLWLIIIGLIAIAIEGVWGWHRGGYYGRRGPAA